MADEKLEDVARAIYSRALKNRLMAFGAPDRDIAREDFNLAAKALGGDLPRSWQRSGLTGVGASDMAEKIVVYTVADLPKTEQSNLHSDLS